MTDLLADLYPAHLATLRQRAETALERAGREHLVIPAGTRHPVFLDDQPYPFKVNPDFKAWLPITRAPGSWIVYTPGSKPRLIFLQPADYWNAVPAAPNGYWVEHFDIHIIREPEEARALLPRDAARSAIFGEREAGLDDMMADNAPAAVDYWHYQRAFKTPYEIAMLREAERIGVRGHHAAECAFRAGASEFEIHTTYLRAVGLMEQDLPYDNIVGLDEHASILHYMEPSTARPHASRSFLLDAGGQFGGYNSDITRTHAAVGERDFQALIDAVDQAQQGFCAKVRAGQSYPELHLHAHRVIGGILKDFGFIDVDAEAAVATGITGAFFPHGLGHMLGLQVHDIGGFMASDRGGTLPKPEGHPFLRFTRTLAPGMVTTIEPGLYFIDLLLAKLKAEPAGAHVKWAQVDAFRPFGGIRIEDNVVCTDAAPLNLTREAFATR